MAGRHQISRRLECVTALVVPCTQSLWPRFQDQVKRSLCRPPKSRKSILRHDVAQTRFARLRAETEARLAEHIQAQEELSLSAQAKGQQ